MKQSLRAGVAAAVFAALLGTFAIQSPINAADPPDRTKIKEACSEESPCKETNCWECVPGHGNCQDCTEQDPCSEPQCILE
jgi:hypothetical protein